MFRTFVTTAALALSITAAQAQSPITIHFGDLNLSNPGDARVLSSRVQAAAESACAVNKPVRDRTWLFYRSVYEQCVYRISQNTTAHILAAAGQSRNLANN